jgi:phenylalanyl-tRNA synthetase beta chain
MRIPLHWLREYVNPPLDVAHLAERLAMTGTEVERVERHGVAALENFIVGKVLNAHKHPDADRLTVCSVDIGEREPSQIVCGALNVAAGQTVAVAKPGAVMPDGTVLRKAKLRGQESNGMILAEDEVAIGTDHDGIMVLEADGLRPGQPLTEVLPIATEVLVLEVTPNRPDCLGIYGVAREVHAATNTPLNPPPWAHDSGSTDTIPEGITITVDAPKALCPRFTARVFENVTIGPSPLWLKARLTAAGQRPISNVVDITNYVMLLTGQPLHAFDLDRIAGPQLTIRTAHAGEQIETLDGQTRTLDEQTVLIEDADGPTSIAGIMGGARSEVEPQTTRVLLEAANWDGANIHRTSLKLGLRSEASTRFEKQIQPEQAMEAQAVATELMLELTGATLKPGTVDIGGPGPDPQTIRLRDGKIESVLGAPVARERTAQILTALEFDPHDEPDGLDVTVPAFRRADITREADLIEEVARIDGLDKLPASLPSRHGASGRLTETQKLRRTAQDALTAQGLDEVVGWSFVSADLADKLRTPGEMAVELENPMSAEQSRLRTRLIGSLLDIAGRNRARGATTIRLFEAGAVYLPALDPTELPDEPHHLSAVLIGPVRPPTWRDPALKTADFFAAKGMLGALLDTIRAPWTVVADAGTPFLHPGRAARIDVGTTTAGWIGEIHPLVAAQWGIEDTIAAFELDLDAVEPHATRTTLYEDLTSFPELREDLAVIVEDSTTADSVLSTVRHAGAPLLKYATVFDVYRDAQRIGEHKVSLALRLFYRAPDRTLTDEEVAAQRAKIVKALEDTHAGRVRAS